ncbi:hypothetical protein V6N11_000007, partial [Hibiscus sabdariffa]
GQKKERKDQCRSSVHPRPKGCTVDDRS